MKQSQNHESHFQWLVLKEGTNYISKGVFTVFIAGCKRLQFTYFIILLLQVERGRRSYDTIQNGFLMSDVECSSEGTRV